MAEGVRDGFGVGHLASLQPFAIRLEPDMASSFIGLYPIQRGESATHPPLALLALLAHFEEGLEKKRVLALT